MKMPQFSLNTLFIATSLIAIWLSAIIYGNNVAGSKGAIIACFATTVSLGLILAALKGCRKSSYLISLVYGLFAVAILVFGYQQLSFGAIFSKPDIKLARNLKRIESFLFQDAAFQNVSAKIQRDPVGGGILLTGFVVSIDQIDQLESFCDSIEQNAIDNQIRVKPETE